MTLGTCGCCGGIYLLLPGANWRPYESARGGFKVDLPADAKTDMPIPGMKPDPNMKVEGTASGGCGSVLRGHVLGDSARRHPR